MATPPTDPIDWRTEVQKALEEMRLFTRRGFFTFVGILVFGVANLAALIISLRFVIPNVTYDQPQLFKAGVPDDYPVGSTTIFSDKRVALNRDPDGFYAISLICTHLGCTPRWFQNDSMFRCPCHGSRYLRDGVRFYGPAPRPMDNIQVGQAPDGSLFVDRAKVVARTTRQAV